MAGLKVQTNGCGACGGFWQWFKPPHHRFFYKDCEKHDLAYHQGGDAIARKIADLELRFDMQVRVMHYFKNRKPISKAWYLSLCQAYYLGVRVFGKSRFNYNSNI